MTMTKKDVLNYLEETYGTDETVKAFVENERELAKRRIESKERSKAKKKAENLELGAEIVKFLATVPLATPSELGGEFGYSAQKTVALLKPYLEDGTIERTKEGKHVYYSVVRDDAPTTESAEPSDENKADTVDVDVAEIVAQVEN